MTKILNIEIKARIHSLKYVEEFLEKADAVFIGTDRQIDTYFLVGDQRLKLRQGNIENSLILYQRKETEGLKESNVILQQLSKDTEGLKNILDEVIGTKIIVDKTRKIYFIDNVKFHLDKVKNLGYFLEIEAISEDGKFNKDYLSNQCNYYLEKLHVDPKNLVAQSYSDMFAQS